MHIRILLSLVLAVLVSATAPDTFAQQLLYIHTDHLNTPRLVTDGSGTPVWRWDQVEPFGDNLPNEDPDGNGTPGHMPLRFPGQYYDKETNLHYNYFRIYDASIGRYQQADPLGALIDENLYTYASSRPLALIDPFGTEPGDLNQRGYSCPEPNPEPGLEGVHPECSLPALRAICVALGLGSSLGAKGKGGKQRDGTPKNNQAQNKQARDAARETGLNKDQQRQLHDAISGQDLNYHEIVEVAKDIKNGKL